MFAQSWLPGFLKTGGRPSTHTQRRKQREHMRELGTDVDRLNVIGQLNSLFEEIIDKGPVRLSEATVPTDVDGWDSLTHIQLVVAVEEHFDIKFTSEEILLWQNVGEMIDCILSK